MDDYGRARRTGAGHRVDRGRAEPATLRAAVPAERVRGVRRPARGAAAAQRRADVRRARQGPAHRAPEERALLPARARVYAGQGRPPGRAVAAATRPPEAGEPRLGPRGRGGPWLPGAYRGRVASLVAPAGAGGRPTSARNATNPRDFGAERAHGDREARSDLDLTRSGALQAPSTRRFRPGGAPGPIQESLRDIGKHCAKAGRRRACLVRLAVSRRFETVAETRRFRKPSFSGRARLADVGELRRCRNKTAASIRHPTILSTRPFQGSCAHRSRDRQRSQTPTFPKVPISAGLADKRRLGLGLRAAPRKRKLLLKTVKQRASRARACRWSTSIALGGKRQLAVVRCYDRTFALGLGEKDVVPRGRARPRGDRARSQGARGRARPRPSVGASRAPSSACSAPAIRTELEAPVAATFDRPGPAARPLAVRPEASRAGGPTSRPRHRPRSSSARCTARAEHDGVHRVKHVLVAIALILEAASTLAQDASAIAEVPSVAAMGAGQVQEAMSEVAEAFSPKGRPPRNAPDGDDGRLSTAVEIALLLTVLSLLSRIAHHAHELQAHRDRMYVRAPQFILSLNDLRRTRSSSVCALPHDVRDGAGGQRSLHPRRWV